MSYAGSTTTMVDLDPHWSSFSVTTAVDTRTGLGASTQYIPNRSGHSSHASSSSGSGSHLLQGDESFLLIDSTRLLYRWNRPHAQANLWLFAGVGIYGASGTRDLITLAVPTDPTAPIPIPIPPEHNHGGGSLQPISPQPSPSSGGTTLVDFLSTTPSSLRIAARPGLQFDAETTRYRFEAKAMLYLAPGIERPLLSATAGAALREADYNGFQPWAEVQIRAMPGVVDQLEIIPKLRILHKHVVLDIGYSNLGSIIGGLTYTF